jgi:crotonobetainyl-CoA:carnitine CoA-transferase CaiB-like acyl-CoA transferase
LKRFSKKEMASQPASALPLAGIRVIDFGRFIAAPYCAMLLADMGADVIRVDRRQGSEDRYIGPVTDQGEGAHFLSLNRNKRSVTLDTSKPESRIIIKRLAASADVVLANLPVSVMKKLGLDFETLSAQNPRVILARISAFGPEGPYSGRIGFDAIAQAMSGAMSVTGFAGAPVRSVVPFEDFGTALHTAFGIMVALYHRISTGRGQIVDGSLFATAVTFMQPLLGERGLIDLERPQIGNAGFYSAPTDVYRAKDGWLVLQTIGSEMFERWAKLVTREDLISDPGFADDRLRQQNRLVITEAMNQWLSTRTVSEALGLLEAARLPAGRILSLDEVVDDPHLIATNLLPRIPCKGAREPVRLANTPVRLSETPGSIRRSAPALGEDTDDVLRELGFSEPEVANLRSTQVV